MSQKDRPQGVSATCSTDHFAVWNMINFGTNIDFWDKYRHTHIHCLAVTLYLQAPSSNVARMDTFGDPRDPFCPVRSIVSDPSDRPEGGLEGL